MSVRSRLHSFSYRSSSRLRLVAFCNGIGEMMN